MRFAVNLLPNRTIFRNNLALYANYAGDFELGEKEARSLPSGEYSILALAMAQLGLGQIARATDDYQKLAHFSATGMSLSASGLADIALLEGRFSDAVRVLREGIANDLARNNRDAAARKLAAVAHAEVSRGRKRAAIDAAEKAITMTNVGVCLIGGLWPISMQPSARTFPPFGRRMYHFEDNRWSALD